MRAWLPLFGLFATALGGCGAWQPKVPITDVNASFALADATWFEDEHTLFVFYRVDAEQGLGPESQFEIAWRTDTREQEWTALQSFAFVHPHVEVDCGRTSRCGSASIFIPEVPRDVRFRLRYHREGQMTLDAPVALNLMGTGPAHTNRSLVVYGVFEETNTRVQWRARHQFPTLRNHEVQDLGLRRRFVVSGARHGSLPLPIAGNDYGYAFDLDCPASFVSTGSPQVETIERAIFEPDSIPITASVSNVVCARALVEDAKGTFETTALARKNPEVAPAFPMLRSPITENVQVGFFLRICGQELSEPHRAMQVQRLLLEGSPEICIDNWASAGFHDQLASQLQARLDLIRAEGKDMVLSLSLHHDDRTGKIAAVLEEALAKVLPVEAAKSSPRVSGAFVFDTFSYTAKHPDVRRLALWCPANRPGDDLDVIPSNSEMTCPLLPDLPDLVIGPLRAGNLPILPTRPQYLEFIEDYSDAQAGRTKKLTFRAPQRTPISENVPIGDFGVATFFNDELLTAVATDRFSYCPPQESTDQTVFRIQQVPDLIPLAMLPELHAAFPQSSYALGIGWDFPFLLRLEYEVVVAGAASAYNFTIPFGVASDAESYYGSALWEKGEFPLQERLLRCKRFCEHPTFDSGGVYNIGAPFEPTYRAQCYRPRYPVPSDGGFPIDP